MKWEEIELIQIAERITKGTTPTTMGYAFQNSGINFVRAEGISKDGFVDTSTFLCIDEECHQKMKRSQLKNGDILISIAGMALGKTGLVTEDFLPANTNQAVGIIRLKKELAFPKFVQYWFVNPLTYKLVNTVSGQSAQPNINLTQLGQLVIPLPPLPTQQKIATILSAYDDLIENNLKRIRLLEEAAQHLYREWFVRFRFPGWEEVRVVDGLPEGWERKKLSEVLELNYGKALKAEDRKKGTFPVFGSSGNVGFHNESLVKAPGIIVGRKGNVGSIFWSFDDFYPIDTVYFVSSKISFFYLFFNLKAQNFVNSDSAVPGLNRNSAYQLEAIVPATEILIKFEKIVQPFFWQKNTLEIQNQKLKKARDILLPRLMNQTIEV